MRFRITNTNPTPSSMRATELGSGAGVGVEKLFCSSEMLAFPGLSLPIFRRWINLCEEDVSTYFGSAFEMAN
jgi:hypothetical protein